MIDVLVVGAGPSGIALAILLLEAGRSVRVLESRTEIGEHSRAIGIHPRGIEVLDRLGVGQAAVRRGVAIRRGVGISRGVKIAELGFDAVASPHRFVLSLPQNQTLELLRARLQALDPSALLEGCPFMSYTARPESFEVRAEDQHGSPVVVECRFLVGADGTRSMVRAAAMVPFQGRTLTDCYLMGDFPDETGLGPTAALFLHQDGITESFPLPGNQRRWVCRLNGSESWPLPELIQLRTGHRVKAHENSMLSRFATVEQSVRQMNHGRLVLIGDAAHQISPIGGQGMTLGLLDAQALSPILDAALEGKLSDYDLESELAFFSERRLAEARRAARQSRMNMVLGRPLLLPMVKLRDALARALFASDRFSAAVAAAFTMTKAPGP